jgi:uncharacterized membrane protein YraQ (UPF0718 family)
MRAPIAAQIRQALQIAAQHLRGAAASFMSISLSLKNREKTSTSFFKIVGGLTAWAFLYGVNGKFWNWLLFKVIGLDSTSKFGEAIHFFLYDSVKILLLLTGITFVVTLLRTFITIERTRAFLGGKREGLGNVVAASAGIVTPFCSCSAVPVFIGFLSSGIPIGVTLSFLIASPLINEIAVGLLFSMFGLKIAAIYMISGLLIAVAAGFVLGKMKVERWVEPFVYAKTSGSSATLGSSHYRLQDRVELGLDEVKTIVKKIWPYLLAGIAVGALIHGWAPTEFFAKYAGASNPFAVLLAVLIGIPLYSNAAGVMPIVQALHDKGLPMGTLLAFMMAVVALSLPEMILLRRVLLPKLLFTYIAIVGSGIIFVGYLFNAIL